MRIRKAEKLLGFTSENRTAQSPPTPWDSAAAIVAAAGLLCEINRSCRVDESINLHSSYHQKEELEVANDEEEEMGVVGRCSDVKEEKEKLDEKVEDKEEIKNVKEPARKRRDKEAEATGMIKCKKMTGEGWHSNLEQLSSYHARLEEKISGDDGGRTGTTKSAAAAVFSEAGTGTTSDCFDDYYILAIDSRESASAGNESSVLDDEYDREALADALNGADNEGVDGGNLCNFSYKKKTRPPKKRGRKPVKARSLKSLLSFKVC